MKSRAAFSTIIVHSILFIAAAVAAYLFVSSLYKSLYDVQGAMIQREQVLSDRLKTIIDIDSCSYNSTTANLTLYVTNRGTISLDPKKISLFIDGIYANNTIISLESELIVNNIWDKYEILKIISNTTEGTHLVKVVVSNGAYDEKTIYTFNNTCTVL